MNRLTTPNWLRIAALLAAAAVFALFPLAAAGKVVRTIGDDNPRVAEGDPIDSNDFDGDGGGSHDDMESTDSLLAGRPGGPVLALGRWTVLLVPDRSLGVTVFSFLVIERQAPGGEGWNAQ